MFGWLETTGSADSSKPVFSAGCDLLLHNCYPTILSGYAQRFGYRDLGVPTQFGSFTHQ